MKSGKSPVKLYFVETTVSEQRDLLCRWAEHFYDRGGRVLILTDSTPAARYIDELLWTFSQGSFIPHALSSPEDAAPRAEPVIIAVGEIDSPGCDVVLCDAPARFEFMRRFETAVHFILRDDPEKRQESRLLWQKARDLGENPVHISYGRQPDTV